MKREFLNEVAKIAAEKFNEAKELILDEMRDALNSAERCDGSDKSLENVLECFRDHVLCNQHMDCDCCMDCEDECCDSCNADNCPMGDIEGDEIVEVNTEAIDLEEDYRDICVMFGNYDTDNIDDTEVAILYDSDIPAEDIATLLIKAIVELLWNEIKEDGYLTKEEIKIAIGTSLMKGLGALAIHKVMNIVKGE